MRSLVSNVRASLRELAVPPRGQMPALDALRTAAILLVVLDHFSVLVGRAAFPRSVGLLGSPPFRFGWTGVDLFFVLSGTLIGRQLWREYQRTGHIEYWRFILRRGLRIWPLYAVFLLISPALTARWSYRPSDWIFVSNYIPGRIQGGWSLSSEEQFYVLAPLAILGLTKLLGLRRWPAAIAALLLATSAVRWWTAHPMLASGLPVQHVKDLMYEPLHLHNEGLLIGLLIALVSVLRPAWIFNGPATPVRRVVAAAGAAMALGVALRAANDVVFPYLALALIYGGLTVILLASGARVFGVLRAWPFYTLSRLSYGMYLNHFAVLRWLSPPIARAATRVVGDGAAGVGISLALTIACSSACAAVLFVLVEQPFLRLRERLLTHPVPTPPVAIPAGATPFPARPATPARR